MFSADDAPASNAYAITSIVEGASFGSHCISVLDVAQLNGKDANANPIAALDRLLELVFTAISSFLVAPGWLSFVDRMQTMDCNNSK